MTSSDSSFNANVSRGVEHLAEADIETIRDLLRGYGSHRSIIKELIQNAEDAGATRLDFIYLPADQSSGNTLARTPGLLVVNDGPFTDEHRRAIFRINLGTKGTDDRAIGRFGKGLKSVFAWCEAFFITAQTNPALGWPAPSITDLFNPWHGWRHANWEEEFRQDFPAIAARAKSCVSALYPDSAPWLAFWFPLRHSSHMRDEEGEVEWIFEGSDKLPGDDAEFMPALANALSDLAPSLVTLRHLKQITMADGASVRSPFVDWRMPDSSQRIPEPDGPEGRVSVEGEALLRHGADRERRYRYIGLAGRLPAASVSHLEEAQDWPRVVKRTQGRSMAGCKAKGKPHYAALITSDPTDAEEQNGSFELRWCVSFPVGLQPGPFKVNLARNHRHIVANLHGFFFLDSERLRIDGLETGFNPNGATSSKSCLEWNRLIATKGTLLSLPRSFADFARYESLSSVESAELAEAMRKTWVWSIFQKEMCRSDTWRPRWRDGLESWQCISSSAHVLAIPHPTEPQSLLDDIPALRSLGEQQLLSVRGVDRAPGLYVDEYSPWPEDLVLRLFRSLQLDLPLNDETVSWINIFLDDLWKSRSLTATIRDNIVGIPLLSVTDARVGCSRRISVRDWISFTANGRLFVHDVATGPWLSLLCDALPQWSCAVSSSHVVPSWFEPPIRPTLDAEAAAAATLKQTTLGDFRARSALVRSFGQQSLPSTEVRAAMRYLMHASSPNARSDQSLFVPSIQHGQHIWSRLIGQILKLEAGGHSWRLLGAEWGGELNLHIQERLRIHTIDAEGAWNELSNGSVDLGALPFSLEEWSTRDVSTLLKGLFEAGQNRRHGALIVLRKLKLHTQRGGQNERVSIADPSGALDDHFVLDKAAFEDQLPNELLALWQAFLVDTKVVERLPENDLASTVQKYLFERTNADNTQYVAELDWNYVVRRSLAILDPCTRAPLILEALRHGDQVARGIGQTLKGVAWLPLSLGGSIAPQDVVAIEGIEADLHRLLDPTKDGLAGIRALPQWVCTHPGFPTLRKYLPDIEEAVKMLGLWLDDKPQWRLGLTGTFEPAELGPILADLAELENMPVAALLADLRRVRVRGYEDGIDSLLREYVLPSVLKSFQYFQDGVEKLEYILRRLQDARSRAGFDAYLSQACKDARITPLLPTLSLVNQRNQWIPASQLTWPSANIDEGAQVCADHARILGTLHSGGGGFDEGSNDAKQRHSQRGRFTLSEAPDFEAEAVKLATFLQPFRNGNIGDNLPAALVAVLGNHPTMLALLQELLRSTLHTHREDFVSLLLGDKRNKLHDGVRFLVEIVGGATTSVTSITGDIITVDLTRDVRTLIVGDSSDLWWNYYYHSAAYNVSCHLLRLRAVEHPDELDDPVAVFATTIETIFLKAHCNGVVTHCPSDIKDILGNIADGGQADLRRSRAYLLDMAEARLKELGVRGIPALDHVLQKFTAARQARVDAELLTTRMPTRSRQRLEDAANLVETAKRELTVLLESSAESTVRDALVDAVRRKMTDFQYNAGSVIFELFQNADDATAELSEMQNGLDATSSKVIVQLDTETRTLDFIHWGRPINQHECPGFRDGLKRGYDQDLQKMLTLNFSDKGVPQEDSRNIVTGRFGLGFKSVFFVSDQPEIISGRLAFNICGGFFPVSLPQGAADEMRNYARGLGPQGAVPTAVRLKWAEQSAAPDLLDSIDAFSRAAVLLAVFSRQIRTVMFRHNGAVTAWTNIEEALTESARVTYVRVGSQSFICFRCRLSFDQHPAAVLFQLTSTGVSQLPRELAGLWITVPTAEPSELRWALNAPFKPDAGRQRLALNNPENRRIAESLARTWGDGLLELFEETDTRWARFSETLELHADASHQTWWSQIWRETTTGRPRLEWDGIPDGGQVLNWIAWSSSVGAMRRLVHQRPGIPSDLFGPYSKMLMAQDVQFCLSGLLADLGSGCFDRVAQWESTQRAFPPGKTVGATAGGFCREAKLGGNVLSVTLEQVLGSEIGPQRQVSPVTGSRVGSLFNECGAALGGAGTYAVEVQHLLGSLKNISLLGTDDEYHPASELICNQVIVGLIDADEALRAEFAPASAILSTSYSSAALVLFIKARGQLTANAVTLAAWARDTSGSKLTHVFNYLTGGDLGQHLADQLGRSWLETNRAMPAWQQLSTAEENEIDRKFSRGHLWQPAPLPISPPEPVVIKQEMDAEEAFRLVSAWWQKEGAAWVARYEGKTYPTGFPGTLPWPGEDEWEQDARPSAQERWLILFIHAALVPLGFNMVGRDQGFSQFLAGNNWLKVLATISEDPAALLRLLDQYLNKFIENTQYHFQMRQFVAFYAVANNLEMFLLSLKEAERSNSSGVFHRVFAPKANFALDGTGIDAPPLTGMLGIGACQLFRELYRLGRLSNSHGYRFAFTPIRKVRRLCTQLFGTPEGFTAIQSSELIFDRLNELSQGSRLDPTFDRCFDLPLQFLAQDEALRTRVLNINFVAESCDDDTLDAAPQLETI